MGDVNGSVADPLNAVAAGVNAGDATGSCGADGTAARGDIEPVEEDRVGPVVAGRAAALVAGSAEARCGETGTTAWEEDSAGTTVSAAAEPRSDSACRPLQPVSTAASNTITIVRRMDTIFRESRPHTSQIDVDAAPC